MSEPKDGAVVISLEQFQSALRTQGPSLDTILQYFRSSGHLNLSLSRTAEWAWTLETALEHCITLQKLDLSYNDIDDAGAGRVASVLEVNTTITHLDLHNNCIKAEGVGKLACALQHNTTLTLLNLHMNCITDGGAGKLAAALEHNTTLQTLNLNKTGIMEDGAVELASALERNTTLTELSVASNSIGVGGMMKLASALEHNTTLKDLELDADVPPEGCLALGQAIRTRARSQARNSSRPRLFILRGDRRPHFQGPRLCTVSKQLGVPWASESDNEDITVFFIMQPYRELAFVMGRHSRLGGDSLVALLISDVARIVLELAEKAGPRLQPA